MNFKPDFHSVADLRQLIINVETRDAIFRAYVDTGSRMDQRQRVVVALFLQQNSIWRNYHILHQAAHKTTGSDVTIPIGSRLNKLQG